VAHEVGSKLDDSKESLEKEVFKLEGVVPALQQAAKLIEDLCQAINVDIDEDKVPGGLDTAAYAKKYVLEAKEILNKAVQRAIQAQLVTRGRVEGMELAVKATKKFHDDERNKLLALQAALETDDGTVVDINRTSKVTGQHPGPNLKDQRLAEDKAKSQKIRRKRQKKETSIGEPNAKDT
jgi:predicted ribosome quality control (RQC) complex YloA/Tae2 family protein